MPRNKAHHDIVKKSSRRSKVIPFKKKRNYKKLFLLLVLLGLTIYIALFTPLCNIKSIEVYGNEKFKSEEIVNMTGIPIGVNIFKVNYFQVKRNIVANQYIESVKISRRYPSKVRLAVIERKPAGYFNYMGSYLIIDKTGIVLDLQNNLNGLKIPVIIGVNFKDYKVGTKININKEDNGKFIMALKCINESLVNSNLDIVSKIDVTDISKITMWVYNDKYEIKLTDENNIPYNVKFYSKQILPDLEKNKSAGGIIDFTIPNKPTFKPR